MTRGQPIIPERTRLINAQADRAERINRTESGELVPAADVQEMWKDIVIIIRQRLLAIPARLTAAHPGNPRIITTLERKLHSAPKTASPIKSCSGAPYNGL